MKDRDQGGLRVIGAGMGRTGTSSLKHALEQLGYAPCHHMEEVIKHPRDVSTWEAAARGEHVDWVSLMRGWRAAVDFPSALYYRELMAAFPEAKVILTVRDPDAWYDSMRQTIIPAMTRFPNRLVSPILPYVGAPKRVMRPTAIHRELVEKANDREALKRTFIEWNEEVKRTVPKDRLLVFEAKEGWEPLSRFLGVDAPKTEFPRVNDTATFRRRVNMGTAVSWGVLLTPPLAGALLLHRWLTR